MKHSLLKSAVIMALGLASVVAHADDKKGFTPIAGSAYSQLTDDGAILNTAPWLIPQGYTQTIVSDESNLDIYSGISDLGDMNTTNETRKQAGRFLFRAHEVRPRGDVNAFAGGSVSVVDLNSGAASVLVQRQDWEAIDGMLWTPWGTLLTAEESNHTVLADPEVPLAQSGLVYEIFLDKKDPTKAVDVKVRSQIGSMAHEGIEVDAEGNIYVIDEDRAPGGSIYKFVPDSYGDLSKGQLYALRVMGQQQTGMAEWIKLDLDQATFNAQLAAEAVGATSYCRPEDLERIGKTLYVALTCEPRIGGVDGPGAVLSISLGKKPQVDYFVEVGVNATAEDKAAGITGLKRPDNLANGPDGSLWIVEDNVPSDIWVATPDRNRDGKSDKVSLFASLRDNKAEGTGIYFSKDADKLFVNVQHSATGNDKTMVISKTDDEDNRVEDREDK